MNGDDDGGDCCCFCNLLQLFCLKQILFMVASVCVSVCVLACAKKTEKLLYQSEIGTLYNICVMVNRKSDG